MLVLGGGAAWWLSQPAPVGAQVAVTVPVLSSRARAGEGLFNRNCAACHGANAAGSDQGPPLIHRSYEPGHRGARSFLIAARNGVRAKHWRFGNLPPVGRGSMNDRRHIPNITG